MRMDSSIGILCPLSLGHAPEYGTVLVVFEMTVPGNCRVHYASLNTRATSS